MPLGTLLLGVFLAAAAEGGGEGDARILVVAPASARVEELYAGLRAAGLLPVSVEERAGVDLPLLPDPVPGTRDNARAQLQDARARLRELDADGARAAADAAVDELVRLDRPEEALELFADALLFRANLALVEGRLDDARADLLLTARLEPTRSELHPGLYPPSLVEAYAAVRGEPPEPTAATLVVRPRAAGFQKTRILVDGQPWGGAGLPPGPHLLTVHADGAVPRSEVRVLEAATPTILEPFLAPLGAGALRAALAARARDAKTTDDSARALASLADACAARMVLLEQKGRLLLFVPEQPLVTLAPPARDGNTVGRVVLAALQPAAARSPRVDDEPGPSPALVWGAVSVAAAVVVLGSAAGTLTWVLWPAEDIAPPPPPVPVGCCTD